MNKRKLSEIDEEDAQDQESQDNQDSDEDFEPSPADNEGDRQSAPSVRVTRSRAGVTAEAQEESGDGGREVTVADNTPGAPLQSASDDHPVRNDGPDVPELVSDGRVRRMGKTKYCGVLSLRIKEPVKAKRDDGDFVCIICGSRFTRAEGVNYHFIKCVEKYGNPEGNNWNDHPSCASKKSQKDGPAAVKGSEVQPSASKKRCTTSLLLRLSKADPSSSDARAPSAPEPQPGALATGPRATRATTRAMRRTLETRPASPNGSSRTALTPAQEASVPPTRRNGPRQPESGQEQHAPNSHGIRKRSTRSKEPSGISRQMGPYKSFIDESLPPLSEIDAIFHDLVSNAWNKIPIAGVMEDLSNKRIHVATMCSGTESPLLALDKIQDDLRKSGKPTLDIKHLFSAEIVPYKQAYIERNFHPDKLFRDIREIARGGQATTAYGAVTDVPKDVDILIAGFSCVDFSRLNKHGKKMTDIGESGDTFRAILDYAKTYRPGMIILENVDGAPWNLIMAIWQNDRESIQAYFENVSEDATRHGFDTFWDDDDPAYSAMWHKVDAKNYYIPQTRTRKYMICLDRRRFPSPDVADEAVRDWKQYMIALQRKASVSAEAFLLSENDPRLQHAKDEMSKTGKPKRERDWEVCNGRHELYRTTEKLGISRPILDWTNNGSAKASSYLWTDWTMSQVERVWDSIEVSYLRNAAKGFDSFFKSRFWDLSQNIDRFKDETPAGIVSCLTPTGQPFSSMRGGPVVGLEAVALQGLPIDNLLLTRESQKELYDLAGNAMTSTVVGAAILSGLAAGNCVLTRPKESVSQPLRDSHFALKEMRYSELRQEQVLKFDGSSGSSLEELCKTAKASVRLCHCEGQSLTARALIRLCRCCCQHCCKKCGNMPRHDFELLGGNGTPLRTEPQVFRNLVRHAIPTRLEIDGFSSERLEEFAAFRPGQSEKDWRLFSKAILLAFKEEYRYESAKRSHCWTITYDAADSRLELIFDQGEVYWLLYGKPAQSEAGNSRVRKLLAEPLARLTVRGKNMRGKSMTAVSMLEGSWEIRLPVAHAFPITVTPQGVSTDSWEKRLGLQGEQYVEKQVYTSLHVARPSDKAGEVDLDHEIYGDYDLMDNCGTACSSLHKKRPTVDGRDAPPFFLFLDPDRNGPPDHDCYVFSTKIHRLEYGETRYVVATVDREWRPPSNASHPQEERTVASEAKCTVSSRWEPCPIVLRNHQGPEEAYSRFPKGVLSMPVFGAHQHASQPSVGDIYGCLDETATTALLSCQVPGQLVDSVGWQVGHWTIMDQKSEGQIAAAFAWLFARVQDLGGFEDGWRSLGPRPSGYHKCPVCAPEPPKIMWTCSRDTKEKIIPYEDGRAAGEFERKIKARPAPFQVQTSIDDDDRRTGRLFVGLHLPTLVHRALAKFGNVVDSDVIDIVWRLDTHFEAPTRYRLRDFTLTNNKLTLEAEYAFPTGENLRPEQKRSLRWMIGQEADDMAFYEEEIEEATLSQLSWRAEVRVRRSRVVRGGILADEVGYGKTATTLALIDAQGNGAEEYAGNQHHGRIRVKATLILVPPHLVHQWKGQARKFLGMGSEDGKILVIEDVAELAKTSVEQIKRADIVIASWKVLSSPVYMARMSYFAALPQGPSSGERETDAWLTRACDNIGKHMGELVSDYENPGEFAATLKLRLKAAYTDKDILRDVPTQRLKGAKYSSWNPAESVTPKDHVPKEQDLDKVLKHMTDPDCTDLNSMTGVLLHMFDFYRTVVDEYTYVDRNQKAEKLSSFMISINARSRWVLSGTPNIHDFGDVRNLASFLAYNLGIVDDAAGVLKGATIRHIREDRTAAEQFRAFGYSHTAAWHISRQAHAQRFLDKYASKNIAEIGLIKSDVHLRPHFLGPAETILNAELQQQLQSTEMRIVLHGKSQKDNIRFRRYMDLLQGCKTAQECLLKSCSYSDSEDTRSAQYALSGNAMDIDDDDDLDLDGGSGKSSNYTALTFGACETMTDSREEQRKVLVAELKHDLLHAAWLEQQCQRAPESQHRGSHYHQWKSEVKRNGLKDPTATADILAYLNVALKKVGPNTEAIYYRDPPGKAQLEKEKKAADMRKKRDKDKRTADRQAKKASEGKQIKKASRKPKAAAGQDEDSAEFVVSDSDSMQVDDSNLNHQDPKPSRIPKDGFETFASTLRTLTAHLRGLVTELTLRTRALRFARGAQKLLKWYSGLVKEPPRCEACHEDASDYENISINIRCGHLTCDDCILKQDLVLCAVHGCDEGSESYCLRKAVDLAGDGQTGGCGSRLGSIIALINSLPEDEQVLLFVQFEDVMLKMASGLEAAGISNHALSKKASREMVDMMNDFQGNEGEEKKRVLLLNPADETASGINLTNANHVIFASPLLSNTQESYKASLTQCIGRAKRYGQQKTVHVYRFLALRTIDVDILQEREQKTLVRKKDPEDAMAVDSNGDEANEEWSLVGADAVDETLEAGWGSGYDFKSNPTEDD